MMIENEKMMIKNIKNEQMKKKKKNQWKIK